MFFWSSECPFDLICYQTNRIILINTDKELPFPCYFHYFQFLGHIRNLSRNILICLALRGLCAVNWVRACVIHYILFISSILLFYLIVFSFLFFYCVLFYFIFVVVFAVDNQFFSGLFCHVLCTFIFNWNSFHNSNKETARLTTPLKFWIQSLFKSNLNFIILILFFILL